MHKPRKTVPLRKPQMHRVRKPGTRPLNHPASAMPPPTKTTPAVSGQPTPADHPRQSPNFTSVQADLADPHKASPHA